MKLQITEQGKAHVQSVEFAAEFSGYIREHSKELDADDLVRVIILSLCEVDELGPMPNDSELGDFIVEHQREIEIAATPFVRMLTALIPRH